MTSTEYFSKYGVQRFVRDGNMVTGHLCFAIIKDINTSAVIAGIPSGYRPTSDYKFATFPAGSTTAVGFLIGANGDIKPISDIKATAYFELNFTYKTTE